MRIVDGSDFPTNGTHSVGVKRQYCGQLGTIANCQAGVFLVDARPHGTTLRDRRRYLLREWVNDPDFAERWAKGCIPTDVPFQPKNELALAMVQAVVPRQALRCRWFLADEALGRDSGLRDAIADLRLWYLVEVPSIRPSGGTTLRRRPRPRRGSAVCLPRRGADTRWVTAPKGGASPMRSCSACAPGVRANQGRRSGGSGAAIPKPANRKCLLSNAPTSVPPARRIAVSGLRWPLEQCIEVAKQELGMGDDEVRSWSGWHHHMTLVILAHFLLVRLQR
jgi:SRSO17 transposase